MKRSIFTEVYNSLSGFDQTTPSGRWQGPVKNDAIMIESMLLLIANLCSTLSYIGPCTSRTY
jgi:hypothetical protein